MDLSIVVVFVVWGSTKWWFECVCGRVLGDAAEKFLETCGARETATCSGLSSSQEFLTRKRYNNDKRQSDGSGPQAGASFLYFIKERCTWHEAERKEKHSLERAKCPRRIGGKARKTGDV